MSLTPYTWGAHAPAGFSVGTTPIKIAVLGNTASTALYISNLGSVPVFLSIDPIGATEGSAELNKGIAIFPETTFRFDSDSVPLDHSVWAVASAACNISVQG